MNHLPPDITALLRRIALFNDEVAYRQIFDAYYPPLHRFAYCLLKSPEQAEEVASDVLFALWQNREKLPGIDNLRIYLYTIARNNCLNRLKQQSGRHTLSLHEVQVDISLAGKNPEEMCINAEIRKKMEQAVNLLPQRCKLVFRLVREEGFSYKEVAALLQISAKTVDAQLVLALKKITQTLRLSYTTA